MIVQMQIKERRRQTPSRKQKNGLTTERPPNCPLPPAAIPRKVPVSLSTVAEAPSPAHEQIAARAYQLWEVNGRPAGTDLENWLQAEQLLHVEA